MNQVLSFEKQQLFAVLVMIGATRRDIHALHASQLPVLGVEYANVLEPLREAEACVLKVETMLRELAKVSFPELEVPWELDEQTENSV